jgi:hypothetical protein
MGFMVKWSPRLRKAYEVDVVSTILALLAPQLAAPKGIPPWILYVENFVTYWATRLKDILLSLDLCSHQDPISGVCLSTTFCNCTWELQRDRGRTVLVQDHSEDCPGYITSKGLSNLSSTQELTIHFIFWKDQWKQYYTVFWPKIFSKFYMSLKKRTWNIHFTFWKSSFLTNMYSSHLLLNLCHILKLCMTRTQKTVFIKIYLIF